jgi:hypothetical protein
MLNLLEVTAEKRTLGSWTAATSEDRVPKKTFLLGHCQFRGYVVET